MNKLFFCVSVFSSCTEMNLHCVCNARVSQVAKEQNVQAKAHVNTQGI